MSRRSRRFVRASAVTVRDANTGDLIQFAPAYTPRQLQQIVEAGQAKAPTARARKRRNWIDNSRRT